MSDHTCAVPDCTAGIAQPTPMCKRHWSMVPPALRAEVAAAFRRWRDLGWEAGIGDLIELRLARAAAVRSVTDQAGGL